MVGYVVRASLYRTLGLILHIRISHVAFLVFSDSSFDKLFVHFAYHSLYKHILSKVIRYEVRLPHSPLRRASCARIRAAGRKLRVREGQVRWDCCSGTVGSAFAFPFSLDLAQHP
jgi:hypothetical protein